MLRRVSRQRRAWLFWGASAVLLAWHLAAPSFSGRALGLPGDLLAPLVWMAAAWLLVLAMTRWIWPDAAPPAPAPAPPEDR